MATITCVIAAYNEEKRIGAVLSAVSACDIVSEIIVVDDGSIDATSAIVHQYPRAILVTLSENKGKSFAIAEGIAKASGEIIVMLDADLAGMSREHITNLVEPVASGSVDVVMSLRDRSIMLYRLLGLDFITGERVFRKKLFAGHVSEMKSLPSYGLEVFMNRVVIASHLSLRVIPLIGVTSPRKILKLGMWAGIVGDLQTMRHVLSVIPLWEVILQNVQLKKLTH